MTPGGALSATHETIEEELVAYDKFKDQFEEKYTVTVDGQIPETSVLWLSRKAFTTKALVAAALTFCKAINGEWVDVEVPAGNFKSCLQDQSNWIAMVPFGLAKYRYQRDDAETVGELTNYRWGNEGTLNFLKPSNF